MEKERLYVLRPLVSGIVITYMTDGHSSGKFLDLLFIEDLCHQTVALDPVKLSVRIHSDYSTSLLSPVLKSVQAIIRKTCSILHAIDSKNTTLVVELIIPVTFTTLTHFVVRFNRSPILSGMTDMLLSAEVCYRIMGERLLAGIIVNILEEILFIALGMTHLSKNLSVAADDSFDSII